MRIGIDGIPFNQQLTGVGHYTLELARALAASQPQDGIEIVSPLKFEFTWPEAASASDSDGLPPNLSLVHWRANLLTRRWWTIGLPRYVARHPFDVFHGTNFEAPLRPCCPSVVTIHDLSMLLWPQTHNKRLARRQQRRLPLMARMANMIITPTESVREELREYLNIPREKIVAVPEAARSVFRPAAPTEAAAVRKRLGVNDEFLLFVGTIEPRKNLLTLLRAFEKIAPSLKPTLQLVLVGRRGWLVDDLFREIDKSAVRDHIKLTDYLSDEDLRALYSSCRVFIYPSLYEGFGLPPLEAMACGAPVIASRIASISEVCGDAARLVEPTSIDSLAQAIVEVVNDNSTRERLAQAGALRASEFSWQRTARLTREVYEEAINRA
jgi:glycosyltransferase involved in cell wall biosynthesis